MTIRFRTDQNNQRYGFGLTITRGMAKTISSPEGISVFFSDQLSINYQRPNRGIEVEVFILLRNRDRCRFLLGSVHISLVSVWVSVSMLGSVNKPLALSLALSLVKYV